MSLVSSLLARRPPFYVTYKAECRLTLPATPLFQAVASSHLLRETICLQLGLADQTACRLLNRSKSALKFSGETQSSSVSALCSSSQCTSLDGGSIADTDVVAVNGRWRQQSPLPVDDIELIFLLGCRSCSFVEWVTL